MPSLLPSEIDDIKAYLDTGQPLPLVYKHLLFPTDSTDEDRIGNEPKAHILVVDDTADNRNLLRDMLSLENYEVATASDGFQALDLMQNQSFDAVLLDIMMPGLSGIDVLHRIKENPNSRHIPVIMISANNQFRTIVECVQAGAEDYLPKPVNHVLLQARVKSSLARKLLHDKETAYRDRLEAERQRSEQLLLNILPLPIAERLKAGQDTIADTFSESTVVFADIVDFTHLATMLSATELVTQLNAIFSQFDALATDCGLEKIKTMGDAYMAVAGVPAPREDHIEAVAEFALKLRDSITGFISPSNKPFEVRVGIHTGPVVAGVIGSSKFIYDLWGDTVNTASRMQASSIAGQIQVTSAVYDRLKGHYRFTDRGLIEIKGKGQMQTYLLEGRL